MSFRELFFGGHSGLPKHIDIGLTLLRVLTGVAMAVNHGADKIRNPGKTIDGADDMGFPVPFLFGWAAVFAEFFGGILLALGLATRPSAFLIACTMATAAFIHHARDGFKTREASLLFLFIAVVFVLAGSGRYGVDSLLRRKGKS